MRIQLRFSLDHEGDRDIVEYIESLPTHQRSATIRDALRVHMRHDGVTIGDVYDAIKELKASGLAVRTQPKRPDLKSSVHSKAEVDPEILSALDNLGR